MPEPSLRDLIREALGNAGTGLSNLRPPEGFLGSPTEEDRRLGNEWLMQQAANPAAATQALAPQNPLDALGGMTGGPALGGVQSGTDLGNFRLKQFETTDASQIPVLGGLLGGAVQDPSQALDLGLLGAAGAKSLAPRVGPLARQATEAMGPALLARQPAEASTDFALGGIPNIVRKVIGDKPDPRTAAQIEQQASDAIAKTLSQEPGAKPPPTSRSNPQLTPRPMPDRDVTFPTRGGPTKQELGITRPPVADPDDIIAPPKDAWEATRRRSVSPATQELLTTAAPQELKQAAQWLRAEAANEGVNPVMTPGGFARAIKILREDPSAADILRPAAPAARPPTPRDVSGLQATQDVGNRTMAPLESTQVFNDETGWFDAVVGTARENLPGRPRPTGRPAADQLNNRLPGELVEQRRTQPPEGPMLADEAELTNEDLDALLRAGRSDVQQPRTQSRALQEVERGKSELAANQYERGWTRTDDTGAEMNYEPLQAQRRDAEGNLLESEPVGPVRRTFDTEIPARPPTRHPDSWQATNLDEDLEFSAPGREPKSLAELEALETDIGKRRRSRYKPTGRELDLTQEKHAARKQRIAGNPANDPLFDTAHIQQLETRAYRPTTERVQNRQGVWEEIDHPPLWQEITDPSWGVKPGSRMKGPIYSSRPPDMTKEGWQYSPEGREFLMKEAFLKLTGAWQGKPDPKKLKEFMSAGKRLQVGKLSAMQDPDVKDLNYKWGKQRPNRYMDEVEEGVDVANDQGVYDWEGNQVGMNEDVEDLAILNKGRTVDPGDPYAQAGRKRTIDVTSRSGMDEGGNSLVFPDDASAREFYGTMAALKEDKAALGGAAENYLPASEIKRLQEQIVANEEWIDMKRGEYPTQRDMNVGLHDTGRHDLSSRSELPAGMSRYVTDENGEIITRLSGEQAPGGTRKTRRPALKEPVPEAVAARRAELERFGETPEVSPDLEREWRRQDVREPALGVETSPVRPSRPSEAVQPLEDDNWGLYEDQQRTPDYRSREGQGLGDYDRGTRPEQRAMTPDRPGQPTYYRDENGKLKRVEGTQARFNADQPSKNDINRMMTQEFMPSMSDTSLLDNALMQAVQKDPKLYDRLPAWQQHKVDRLEEAKGAGNERKPVRAFSEEDRQQRQAARAQRQDYERLPPKEQDKIEAGQASDKFERDTRTWLQKQVQAIKQSRSRTAREYPMEEKIDIEPALRDVPEAELEQALSKRTVPAWVVALRQEAMAEVAKTKGQRADNGRRLVMR